MNSILFKFESLEQDFNSLVEEVFKSDRLATLAQDIQDLLLTAWRSQHKTAVVDALTALKDATSQADIDAIVLDMETKLGVRLADAVKSELYDLTELIYGRGLNEILKPAGIKMSFSVIDRKTINSIDAQNTYWIGNFYSDQLSADIKQIMTDGMKAGDTYETIAARFNEKFGAVYDKGINYWKGFTTHLVTRAREMSHVSGYVKAGIEYLVVRAVLDNRTTPICLEMHGRIIKVSKAVEMRDAIVNAKNPEDIKVIARWAKPAEVAGTPTDELPVGLSLPPYHFRCRTTTVGYYGTTPDDEGDRLSAQEIAARTADGGPVTEGN